MIDQIKHTIQTSNTLLSGLLIAILAFLIYASTLGFNFVWDDQIVITSNEATLKGIEGLKDIWTSYAYLEGREIYRPIPQTIHALLWETFPENTTIFHLSSTLIYVLVCLSVWQLFGTWFPLLPKWIPLLSTLVFILLPVHTEVVANIKSIDEMLAVGFICVSFIYTQNKSHSNRVKSFLFFLFALLSKVSAITLLPLWIIFAFPQILPWLKNQVLRLKLNLIMAIVLIGFGVLLNSLSYPKPLGILLACLSVPFLFKLGNRHIRFILFLLLTVFLSMNDRWEFGLFIYIPLFYLDVKEAPSRLELLFKYLLFTTVSQILYYQSLIEAIPLFLILTFMFYYLEGKAWTRKFGKPLLLVFFVISIVISFSDSLTFFKPFELFISLLAFVVLLNKDQAKYYSLIILALAISSFELVYFSHEYFRAPQNADSRETEIIKQEDVAAIKKLNPYHNVLLETTDGKIKMATICRIQLIYLQKLFFPTALVHQHGTRQVDLASWKDWDVWFSIVLHLVLLGVAYFFFQRKFYAVTWGIAWYFLSISIYTNIIRLLPDTMAERFLFLPSVGFSLALVAGLYFIIARWQKSEKKTLITLGILLFPLLSYYAYKTIHRTKDWKNNYTLAANTLPNAQNNAAINAQYALELNKLIRSGQIVRVDSAEALVVKHYKRAIEIYPDFYGPNNDLASYFILKAQPDSAFPYLLEAYRLEPDVWLHHYYLGLIYYERNKYLDAFECFDKIIENQELQANKLEYPELLEAYEFAGRCLHNLGRDSTAYVYLQEGINTYQQKSTYILLGNLYRITGKTNLAIETFKALLALYPDDQEIKNTIDYLEQGLIY